ncbi:MAG TPA: PLP-dependent aminotransferase family protein [Sphingomicrobium sp.]|nr:PLP-dependent aminotransferase family protein [Sphingomicrobium sp.]
MDLIFELPPYIPANAGRPSAQAIYELLRSAILNGELAAGCRLPPTRLAGQRFGLSRSTMVAIYERLAAEELIDARRGSGTFISLRPDRVQNPGNRSAKPAPPAWFVESMERKTGPSSDRSSQIHSRDEIELRPGFVDPALFPFDKFRRSTAKALRYMERTPSIHGSEERCQGDHRLRRAIADHATLMRAMACSPDDMVITSGAQQGLDLLARTLVEAGNTVVAIEEPRYTPLAEPFAAAGAVIRFVPVDQDGMIVDLIPGDAKIICVSPSSQFPLGVAMSADRRRQLVAFAKERNILLVEDDYGGELRTGGDPLPTLYSLDPAVTIYVGTFAPCMFPSFRLGYLIAPAWAVDPLVRAKTHSEWQSSSVIQAAAASFITDGYLSAHVARMRSLYRDRKSALIDAIDGKFGEFLRPLPSSYGLNLSAIGNPAINWKAVSERARLSGIQVRSCSQYWEATPRPGLVFGVGVEPEDRLRLAVERLAALI